MATSAPAAGVVDVARGRCYSSAVFALKARVRNGRLLVDEPTELPEGTVVDLVAVDDDQDDLDEEERAALHAALVEGLAQDDAGDTVDADDVIAHLRARAS